MHYANVKSHYFNKDGLVIISFLFCMCFGELLRKNDVHFVQCAWFRSQFLLILTLSHALSIRNDVESLCVNKPKLKVLVTTFVCCALTFKHFKSSKNSTALHFTFRHNDKLFIGVSICLTIIFENLTVC